MHRKLALAVALLVGAVVVAQTPVVPSVSVPSLDLTQLMVDSNQTGADLAVLVGKANLNYQYLANSQNQTITVINDPTSGNLALDARLKVIEAWMRNQAPPQPVVTEDYTALPAGPVVGQIKGGIDFGSGMWLALAGIGLEPAASGTGRTMTIPGTAKLVSVKAYCINPCTLTLTPASTDTVDAPAIFQLGSSPQSFTTNWQQSSGAVSVSVSNGGANLRLVQASYQ